MHTYANTGWIEVIVGCMESGKTEELRRRVRRALIAGKRIAAFVYAPKDAEVAPFRVTTRDGRSLSAVPVSSTHEIRNAVREAIEVVAIDEIHFFEDDIVDLLHELADSGREVIVAGLDQDFRGRAFGPMGRLLAEAEVVDKLYAICAQCHGKASRTQKLVNGRPAAMGSPTVETDKTARYEPRCRACHMVPEES